MFTLKWVASNGAEMLYNAKEISYTPGSAIAPALVTSVSTSAPEPVRMLVARDMTRPIVSFYLADTDAHCTIDNGNVYVMNENGRTVSTWHLSEVAKFEEGKYIFGSDGGDIDLAMTLSMGEAKN